MDRIFKTTAGFTILIAIIISAACIFLLELMDNERIRKTMLRNLERVDELNDMSKIVSDLTLLARNVK